MAQNARSVSDVSNIGWTPTPVYAQINGVMPNDNSFVTAAGDATFEVRLARLSSPVVGPSEIAQTLTVRMKGSGYALVEFLGGGERVIAIGVFALTGFFSSYELTLTVQQAASIIYPLGPGGDPDLSVRVTALSDGGGSGSGSGSGVGVACLDKLCVTRDAGGNVTGLFFTDDQGIGHELPACADGTFPPDPTCVAALDRLCVTTGAGGAVTEVAFADDFGNLIPVPACGSGSGGGGGSGPTEVSWVQDVYKRQVTG